MARTLKAPVRPSRWALGASIIMLSLGAALLIVFAIGSEQDKDSAGDVKSIYKTLLYIGIGLVSLGTIFAGVSCTRSNSFKDKYTKFKKSYKKRFSRKRRGERRKRSYQPVDPDSDTESDN